MKVVPVFTIFPQAPLWLLFHRSIFSEKLTTVTYDIIEAKTSIDEFLQQGGVEFDQLDFPSGCRMVDLRVRDLLYVIQIES